MNFLLAKRIDTNNNYQLLKVTEIGKKDLKLRTYVKKIETRIKEIIPHHINLLLNKNCLDKTDIEQYIADLNIILSESKAKVLTNFDEHEKIKTKLISDQFSLTAGYQLQEVNHSGIGAGAGGTLILDHAAWVRTLPAAPGAAPPGMIENASIKEYAIAFHEVNTVIFLNNLSRDYLKQFLKEKINIIIDNFLYNSVDKYPDNTVHLGGHVKIVNPPQRQQQLQAIYDAHIVRDVNRNGIIDLQANAVAAAPPVAAVAAGPFFPASLRAALPTPGEIRTYVGFAIALINSTQELDNFLKPIKTKLFNYLVRKQKKDNYKNNYPPIPKDNIKIKEFIETFYELYDEFDNSLLTAHNEIQPFKDIVKTNHFVLLKKIKADTADLISDIKNVKNDDPEDISSKFNKLIEDIDMCILDIETFYNTKVNLITEQILRMVEFISLHFYLDKVVVFRPIKTLMDDDKLNYVTITEYFNKLIDAAYSVLTAPNRAFGSRAVPGSDEYRNCDITFKQICQMLAEFKKEELIRITVNKTENIFLKTPKQDHIFNNLKKLKKELELLNYYLFNIKSINLNLRSNKHDKKMVYEFTKELGAILVDSVFANHYIRRQLNVTSAGMATAVNPIADVPSQTIELWKDWLNTYITLKIEEKEKLLTETTISEVIKLNPSEDVITKVKSDLTTIGALFLKYYKNLTTLFEELNALPSSENLEKINRHLQIIFSSISENFSEPISEELQELFTRIIAEVGGITTSVSGKSTESNAKFNQIISSIKINDLYDLQKLLGIIKTLYSNIKYDSSYNSILDERRICGDGINGQQCIELLQDCLSGKNKDSCIKKFNSLDFKNGINIESMSYPVAVNLAKQIGFYDKSVDDFMSQMTGPNKPKNELVLVFRAIQAKIGTFNELNQSQTTGTTILTHNGIPIREFSSPSSSYLIQSGGSKNNYNNFIINLNALKNNFSMGGGGGVSARLFLQNLKTLQDILKEDGKEIDDNDLQSIYNLIDRLKRDEMQFTKINLIINGLVTAMRNNQIDIKNIQPNKVPFTVLENLNDKALKMIKKIGQKTGYLIKIFDGMVSMQPSLF